MEFYKKILKGYPIKIMGDINVADYFLSVLHILSGGPIHNFVMQKNSLVSKSEPGVKKVVNFPSV